MGTIDTLITKVERSNASEEVKTNTIVYLNCQGIAEILLPAMLKAERSSNSNKETNMDKKKESFLPVLKFIHFETDARKFLRYTTKQLLKMKLKKLNGVKISYGRETYTPVGFTPMENGGTFYAAFLGNHLKKFCALPPNATAYDVVYNLVK